MPPFHALLGVQISDDPNGGALITGVTSTGAASHAGLRTGDVITKVDGQSPTCHTPGTAWQKVCKRPLGSLVGSAVAANTTPEVPMVSAARYATYGATRLTVISIGASLMRDTRIDLPFPTAGTMVQLGVSQMEQQNC